MKKLIITLIFGLLLLLDAHLAHATAMSMGSTLSGIFGAHAASMGQRVADPRFASELVGVVAAFGRWAAAAVTVALGSLTAPVWGTIAAAALVGTGVYLAATSDGLKWTYNDSKTVTVSKDSATPQTPPIKKGDTVYSVYSSGKLVVAGNDPQAVAGEYAGMMGSGWQLTSPCTGGGTSRQSWQCTAYHYDSVNQRWDTQSSYTVYEDGAAQIDCGAGRFIDKDLNCHAYDPIAGSNSGPIPIGQAISQIPGLTGAAALNPEIVARVANHAWEDAAAQPGYTGLPYDYAHPITTAEATDWMKTHPDTWPTVADFVTPLDPATHPWDVPLTPDQAGTGTIPNTGTNAGSANPAANLGADPGIGAPQLESTPTAKMILDPLLNLLPDFKNYTVPALGGECPKPSFQAFNQTFTMDKHCDLLEQNRAMIKAGFMLAYALASLFLILKA